MNADIRTRALLDCFTLVKPRRLVDYEMDFKSLTSIENWKFETCAGSGLTELGGQDRSQYAVLSLRPKNEVHGEECCKLAWLGARRILARCGCSNIDGTGRAGTSWHFCLWKLRRPHREGGIQGDVRDRNGAQNTSVEEEENWSIPRTIRIELALPRNLEKEKSIETGAAPVQDQGECRDGETSQENAEQAFQLEINAKDENPESVLTKYIRDLYSISDEQEELTQSERRHWVELWKNMRIDCAGGMLISPKRLIKCLEETEKRERLTGSNHSRCTESIASRNVWKSWRGRCR